MRKLLFLLTAIALSGSPVPAWSDDAGSRTAERVAEVYNDLELSGSIQKIDHAKGTLVLSSEIGNVELAFPPDQIRGFQNGDPVVVDLGFSQQGRSIGLNRMADLLETFNELQVTGTVRSIDYQKGELKLITKAGDVTLTFPPKELRNFKRDDLVSVSMGYSKQGRTIRRR